jgi:formate hydrogenlyase transcriptional activator
MEPARALSSEVELRRYEALLQMADLVVRHGGLEELFQELVERLGPLTSCKLLTLSLHDPAKNLMRVQVFDGTHATDAEEMPVQDLPSGWTWQYQRPLVIPDLERETRFAPMRAILWSMGIHSFCSLPLTTAQRRLGALGFGSDRPNAYDENDARFLQRVADLVALAVDNVLTQTALDEEKERLQMLLEVNAALVANLDLQKQFSAISGCLRKVLHHEFASIGLYEESTQSLRKYALDFPTAPSLFRNGQSFPVRGSSSGLAFLHRETKVFHRAQLEEFPSEAVRQLLEHGIQSICCAPLITRKGAIGTLNLASSARDAFRSQDIGLVKQIAGQIAIALDNDRAYREIAHYTDKLTEERKYLEGEIRSEMNFEEIVGESAALRGVLSKAKTVATSDATVLILGETGTGKELIARAIHRMSSRKDGSFIKLNCAAIPTGLLESELFGHEKGAFTGAISQKIGRLELADKGTLFLDEVGDIPLELQPKLLRVLQDQEFERLGSTRTMKVNVRLVAATNQDLAKTVVAREFRSDLYYRLNVFPIRMPELRERRDDIPLLVRYFVQKFARRMNKVIETVPVDVIKALESWPWPGNVRELENFIERSVILSTGPELNVPLAELKTIRDEPQQPRDNLESVEREHIVRVLRETGGVISGMRGAAVRLGLKRTTLQSRMQKLGISRGEYEN